MNKPIYIRLSMLEIRKTALYAFWYDYIKSKYQDNTKLCYIDTQPTQIQKILTQTFQKMQKKLTGLTMKLKDNYWQVKIKKLSD